MDEKREKRFREVISRRQTGLTVIMENVHDQHNIGAVLRTCDSIGILEIYVLQSRPDFQASNITLGKRTSAGARKWVDVHLYHNPTECFADIRKKYNKIYATHLSADAKSVYDLDFTDSVALLFGNEKYGISEQTLALCDGNFIVPQMGFVQSLNISVACAVSLYEAFRQRNEKRMYNENAPLNVEQQADLYEEYLSRHKAKVNNKTIWLKE